MAKRPPARQCRQAPNVAPEEFKRQENKQGFLITKGPFSPSHPLPHSFFLSVFQPSPALLPLPSTYPREFLLSPLLFLLLLRLIVFPSCCSLSSSSSSSFVTISLCLISKCILQLLAAAAVAKGPASADSAPRAFVRVGDETRGQGRVQGPPLFPQK